MICTNGHEMEIQSVEVSSAHQSGGEIVDAEYQNMWVCTNTDCDETEPITNQEEDES